LTRSDSNPLLQELARSQRAGAHLDADLLAAFGEDALLPRERQEVLAHLAACAECREVLSLANAARPEEAAEVNPQIMPRPARPLWWGWLPWAATAVVILAIGGTLLLHRRGPVETATIAAPPPLPSPTLSSSAADQLQVVTPAVPAPQRKPSKATQITPRPARVAKNSNEEIVNATQNSMAEKGDLSSSAPTAQTSGVANSSVQKVMIAPAPAQSFVLPQSSSRALLGSASRASANAVASHSLRAHWRINDNGQVERSYGNDAWSEVLDGGSSKLRVVSVLDHEVWAGGESLLVYRSVDNGATWSAVKLPEKQSSKSAITHILFQTPLEGTIEADDGSSWVTTDGGITWK
jgi:Putative zinc-finger